MRLMKTLKSSVALSAAVLLAGVAASSFSGTSMAAFAQEDGSDGQGNQGGQGHQDFV